MSDPKPLTCSLGASDLQQRLDEIARLGAASLIDRDTDGGTHTLRFRSDPATRRNLEQIVAAEAKCCSFLDLELNEHNDELILTLDAPADGRSLADGLAVAFGAARTSIRVDARSPSAAPRPCPRRS
jgi:hypothetical protein